MCIRNFNPTLNLLLWLRIMALGISYFLVLGNVAGYANVIYDVTINFFFFYLSMKSIICTCLQQWNINKKVQNVENANLLTFS